MHLFGSGNVQRIALEMAAFDFVKSCSLPLPSDEGCVFLREFSGNMALDEVDGLKEATNLFDVVGTCIFEYCFDLGMSWWITGLHEKGIKEFYCLGA